MKKEEQTPMSTLKIAQRTNRWMFLEQRLTHMDVHEESFHFFWENISENIIRSVHLLVELFDRVNCSPLSMDWLRVHLHKCKLRTGTSRFFLTSA